MKVLSASVYKALLPCKGEAWMVVWSPIPGAWYARIKVGRTNYDKKEFTNEITPATFFWSEVQAECKRQET